MKKPIPLFGTGIRSISDVVTRQRRLNCFYVVRQDADRFNIILVGTPGSKVWTTLPTSPVRGFRVVNNLLYVVAGSRLYVINYAGGYTDLGGLQTNSGYVSMADNGFDLTIVDGTAGYVLVLRNSSFTTITDANFPSGCSNIAYNGERYIVDNPNTRSFVTGAQLDGITWTPYLFATKEDYSDNILAIDSFNGLVILWGDSLSIEFWQNVGSYPLPFQKVVGATQAWGLAAKYSRAVVGNMMMFLGRNPDGGVQVMSLAGATISRVSTDDVDDLIQSFVVYQDAVALTYIASGHTFYQLTFPSAGRTLLYDATAQMWHEAQTGVTPLAAHYGRLSVSYNGRNYFCDDTTGNVYQFDDATYTDNGTPIPREVYTKHVRNAGNRMFINELFLDMEVGGSLVPLSADPQVVLQVSKDGGKTFGPEKPKPLGQTGQYLKRLRWLRLGGGYDFVFRIRMTDPVKFVLASGSADTEVESVS